MRPYKKLAAALVLLTALAAVFALFEPWPLAFLIDSVIGHKRFPSFLNFLTDRTATTQILFSVLLGFAFILINQALAVLTRAVDSRLELGMVLDFRSNLFQHIQGLSFQFHEGGTAGRFIYQVNYIAHDAGSIPTSILPMAQALLTLGGMFFVTYRLEPQLALAATAVVPFVYYATTFYGRHIEPELIRVRELEGDSMVIIHEKLSIVRVVVSFCRERYEHARFRAQGEVALNARVRVTIKQTLFSLGVAVITAAGTALVLFIGAKAVLRGELSVGQLLVVLTYVAAVYQPLEQISQSLANLQRQLIQMDIVFGVLDTEPEVKEKLEALELEEPLGRIELETVSFHYDTRTSTLDDINLTVEPGEFVAIVGPTGAGKTTLISLIPRFFDPQQGRVLIDGHDVRDLTLLSLRSSISLVMQDPILFMGTIADNIRYGRLDATHQEVVAAAKAANAHDFIEQLPDGYRTKVGERGTRVSGGERQRIAVARAFLKDAPILILDEPTSSIDSRTETVILDALERLAAGRTTIMIAHRLSTIRMADRILVLDDGRLVEQGTHAELLVADGMYASLWRAQTEASGPPAIPEPPELTVPGAVRSAPVLVGAPTPFEVTRPPKVVVLGMMTKIPVAGVVWQTIHYLVGLARLGVEVFYVEAHARTPSMFMEREPDDASAWAAAFIGGVMHRFGFDGRWGFHALHDDGAVLGMSRAELLRTYAEADLIINLHGGTEPLPEHSATGRLVYVETDPVQLQMELHERQQATIDFLDAHVAFFTFGENYGRPDCRLPVSDRFHFAPTRQPVVCDFWEPHGHGPARSFTTVGNWRQEWREVTFQGQTYYWSKHREFLKVIDLPRLTAQRFELALSGCTDDDRRMLESRGWHTTNALDVSLDLDRYRNYIGASRGEFTVAKDQNVRLRSGWFSDRSATYLAAGRPVVTQDTGFGNILPTGEGLFAFATVDDIAAAVEDINGDYERHRRASRAIAREYFDYDAVLRPLLTEVGIPLARRRCTNAQGDKPANAFPAGLDLSVVSRNPTTLTAATVSAVLGAPVPSLVTGLATTPPAVTVVIVVHDNLVFTRLCVESVISNTGRSDVEIVVVDNASDDMTPAYLEQLASRSTRVRSLRNDQNLGFATGANQGLKAARGSILVLLNNDTIVAPGWLDRLERHVDDPDVGMVGPLTNGCPNEARINVPYTSYGGFVRFAAEQARDHEGHSFDIDVLTMFCVALRREVYERIGPLDERFEVGMFEDDDYALRLRNAGLRAVCAKDVVVHHFGEATLGKLVPTGEYGRIFEANKRRFESKWSRPWDGHQGRRDDEYERLVSIVREAVTAAVPEGETVLVVSKGDDELLAVESRAAWHFPQQDDGTYAGWYPATTNEVIEHLGRLAGKGASYIVFPETAAWWFEFYDGLEALFAEDYEEVGTEPGCRIFALRQPARAHGAGGR